VGIGKRKTTVASVGQLDISAREFLSLYTRQTEEIRKLLGTSLNIDKGRQFGYVDRALSSLVNRALFNNQAIDLGLSVSDVNVRDRIIKDDSFKDDLGQFSELMFRQLISESGYTEDSYVEGTRQDLARDQMVETIRSSFILPKIISNSIGEYNLEERSINFITVKSKDQKFNKPTEESIKLYYDENNEDFKSPEFREVETLLLDANEFAKNTTVTNEEIELLYEERKESLIKPERRYLKQILVSDAQKAKDVIDKLKDNKNDFSITAKNLTGLEEDDIDLGWNTRDELPEDIVDQVFSLKKDSISQAIESSFGFHIFLTVDVEERKELSYQDVEDNFRNELLIEKAKDAVYELQDEIEDSLSGGETLKEISEKLEVQLITAQAIDSKGFNLDGSKNQEFQDERILRAVFNQKENEEGNLIDIDKDNGLAISIVTKIYPPKIIKFNKAKSKVEKKLIERSQYEYALSKANKIKDEINTGTKIEKISSRYNLKIRGVAPFNRIQPDTSEVPLPLVSKIFETKINNAVTHSINEEEIIIAQVAEIINAYGNDKEGLKSFNERIEDDMSVDLLSQFSEILRKKYKISINDDVINQLN
tara:strand:+ start:5068 stop:6849 length:1782 start_codon:yes stop_codon:yes gene_type:complete